MEKTDFMQVFLHHSADKYLKSLNADERESIREALKNLEKEPPEGDIEPYKGNPDRFRLKIGGKRALLGEAYMVKYPAACRG